MADAMGWIEGLRRIFTADGRKAKKFTFREKTIE